MNLIPNKIFIYCTLSFDDETYNLDIQSGVINEFSEDELNSTYEKGLQALNKQMGVKGKFIPNPSNDQIQFVIKNTYNNLNLIYITLKYSLSNDILYLNDYIRAKDFYLQERPGSDKIYLEDWPEYIENLNQPSLSEDDA